MGLESVMDTLIDPMDRLAQLMDISPPARTRRGDA